ncbi:Zinc finger protein 839 [Anthophora plagiata]
MAEISNSTVFTSDASSTGASDLLQQAFQQVVDDDDHDNEFVAFLQNDDNDSQTIHLTPEQAAALGLTFEVNSSEEVIYQQDQDNVTSNLQENICTKDSINVQDQNSLSSQDSITINQLNYQTEEVQKSNDNELIKTECIDFQEWHMQKVPQTEQLQDQVVENGLSLEEINLNNQNHEPQQIIEHQNNIIQQSSGTQTIVLEQSKVHAIKPDVAHTKNIHESDLQYTVEDNIAQNQLNAIPNSQAQILQKLPVIFPSSQFIIKPAQTILKPAKNIRLFQGSNKLTNTTINPINTVHSLNTNSNPNSVLLSKATILNNLSPQIIKATPITAQLLNTSGISAQLLNTSQILAGACEIQNQSVGTSHISNTIVNTTSGATQNLVTSQIRLSPIVKTSQPLQRGNVQQFLTPVLKGASTVLPKSNQILNNTSVTTAIPAQFLKSVQIPSQLFKTKATIGKKATGTTGMPKTTINSNTPVVLRTASIVKTQDLKIATTSSTSILKPTQISSTPISILKPQAKIALNNSTKQNVTIATQNVGNILSNSPNISQKIPAAQQSGTFESTKSMQNETNKQKLVANGTNLKVNKKAKSTPVKSATVVSESTDVSKPLGSSENPIQIVQQGQTFHSMQRLTPTQLKQIAHVLQQRSQEATAANERVVYRVVFPEELDLRIRNPGNLLKNRGGKRGRPKKSAIRPSLLPPKPPPIPDEEQEELKDERKKVVARTRSGRLSRPPRHMVRDYKHLHHLDFLQPDLDDSDGGYSDYNTNNDKIEEEESPKELLTGLEVPKRKISDHFRCPTCNKIYLGRTRMARHFEMHPDHGSPEQLPPPTPEPELKQNGGQDPLKRKGKKRGPWAYVTPEAKSERRQIKLREAISVCEDLEIIKIAAMPVLNAQSLFDLLVLKSENNVRNFLNELKQLMNTIREKAGAILTVANSGEESSKDLIDIGEESLCDALGLNPGVYKINNEALKKVDTPICSTYDNEEPPLKLQKTDTSEDGKENIEERMSSGFSESSDLSVSDFLSDRRSDSVTNPTCPEVLSALTLMRRNPSPANNTENNKPNNMSKLLISSPEIQNQISDNPGFQKVDIISPKISNYQKTESRKENFAKLGNNLGSSNFCKVEDNYEQPKIQHIDQAFIKLEPTEQGFVKLENGAVEAYPKQDTSNFEKVQNSLNNIENGSQNFAKGFQKLVSKIIPITSSDMNCVKTQSASLDTGSCKILPATSGCKISDNLPILQDTVPIISNNCDTNIFGSSDNLDMSKIAQYDHITHLDILNTSGVIDKNLLIDEKLVEQLHLVDQSNLVDELVSERLKNIMPDNILENNLIPNNSNLDTDLDFDALSEEFNRNTRS